MTLKFRESLVISYWSLVKGQSPKSLARLDTLRLAQASEICNRGQMTNDK
ncbi:hypothetical protein GXM_01375 [Nostoc sphaeroides CCNUC1]|uniref:Uncharacterized protein n=1 Tax=Nostoc sphaeroides CCNUC1 TaxID=2653204 RepID=A0A5P8VU30_9NOSO|nr:hypothetical protein GXM_01375 [Nostoc sphaeroides CCNUC1]